MGVILTLQISRYSLKAYDSKNTSIRQVPAQS
jgi:hypothetical protein